MIGGRLAVVVVGRRLCMRPAPRGGSVDVMGDARAPEVAGLPWGDLRFTGFFLAASLGPMVSMAPRFLSGHVERWSAAAPEPGGRA